MYLDRRHLKPLLLAIISVAIGLILLAQESGLLIRGMLIQLPALLLIIYGLTVAWWHTKYAVSVFEVQTARAVYRALHSSRGYKRR
jgi:hypothetical protein